MLISAKGGSTGTTSGETHAAVGRSLPEICMGATGLWLFGGGLSVGDANADFGFNLGNDASP